ncbi:hypothetical protein [Methylobrevis pamukkalensis]|nr:hypothetical protein [Methylobrevis pamukkalensis]
MPELATTVEARNLNGFRPRSFRIYIREPQPDGAPAVPGSTGEAQ